MNGIAGDREIYRNELGRIGVVGVDATDPGGGNDHHLWSVRGEESLDLRLALQVEGGAVGGDDFAGDARQTPDNGGANHPGVTGDVNPLASEVEYLLGHINVSLSVPRFGTCKEPHSSRAKVAARWD